MCCMVRGRKGTFQSIIHMFLAFVTRTYLLKREEEYIRLSLHRLSATCSSWVWSSYLKHETNGCEKNVSKKALLKINLVVGFLTAFRYTHVFAIWGILRDDSAQK